MSDGPESSGINGTIGSAYGLLRSLVTSALVLAFLVGWTGFWLAVVRIHYFDQDWVGVVVTAALAAAPVVGVLVWGTSVDGLVTAVEGMIDALTPSSTASTSGE